MGNSKEQLSEIYPLIRHIETEISSGKYFELGDDPEPLSRIENDLSRIHELLENCSDYYISKPLLESNPYFNAVRITRRAQEELTTIRINGEGSRENTSHILRLVDDLEKSIDLLAPKSESNTLTSNKSTHNKNENGSGLSEEKDNHTPPKNNTLNYKQSIFISYAWGGESEKTVNQIDLALQERGIKITRDKRDLGYKGSIKEFMEHIGRGNCVIVVISDKYLRSKNCMFELVEIAENKQFADRVFPVVLPDAKIYDAVERLDYVEHWDQEKAKLNEKIRSLKDQSNLQGIHDDLDNYDRFRDKISGLIYILQDMNTLTPEMHHGSNFSQLYDAIETRLRGTEHW